ncbi:leucine dehydrogenase [Halalkaliarchaeum desulfuricum]|uniref:Leucine dehydrogenase n=1 Tax=Halalkaliarchaeum desulfuricum TaxID=2055893 RepID=A0A343TFM7_9EURY|nr:Glu/Leu/Phe/Val dehydrogenase dimerization domain-containing protein [Halalkaliarchaeum desulfuricum]AUX07899.1 leucine dehydrogenase [Halalkaliarchaeum desulfuricum]
MVLDRMTDYGHEAVTYVSDPETGLQAIVAVHDTTLGPALGGTRMLPYDTEADALQDVLRLSKAMTYKAAAADLDLGGGKAVIVGDPEQKTAEMMAAYGQAVDALGGRYITSVDINTGVEDLDVIADHTDHVVGVSDGLGDPSPVTAYGVFRGVEETARYELDRPVSELSVTIQGIGKVGTGLAERLLERGADVTVSDVDTDQLESFADEYGVATVAPEDVYAEPCDVFAPCAIGGVLNDDTIPQLNCEIVAGGANNVLKRRDHAEMLQDRGIRYAPDYVINAGGLITVHTEHVDGTIEDAFEKADAIGDRLIELYERADDRGVTPLQAAREYAEERLERGRDPLATPA